MNWKSHFVLVGLLAMIGQTVLAHPGRTDKNGGHHNRKTGGYHYHSGGGSSVPEARVEPRTEIRTTPRTEPRIVAKVEEPPPAQVVALPPPSAEDKLQQAREHLGSARTILKNLVEERSTVAVEADILLGHHRLDETAPDVAHQKHESAAASKLTMAKNALRAQQRDSARRWLKEVVDQYPETEAAKEAAELLKRNAR